MRKKLLAVFLAVLAGTLLITPRSSWAKTPLQVIGAIPYPSKTEAPNFALRTLQGKKMSLKSLRGKMVFLNFWATWCRPCRDEMPTMEKLYRELSGASFAMVAVNVEDSPRKVEAFRKELGLTYPVWLDRKGKVGLLYGAWGLPNTYLIAADGTVIGRVIGPRDWSAPRVVAAVKSLLHRSSAAPNQSRR